MKNLIFLWLVLGCMAANVLAADPKNFVTNGGFENVNSNGFPVGWYVLDAGTGAGKSYKQYNILFKSEPNMVHCGKRAAAMLHEDASYTHWVMLRQDLHLPPGEYVYTGYVFWRGRSLARPVVAMHLIDDKGGVTAPEAYKIMSKPAPETWVPFVKKFKVDSTIKTVGLNVMATDGPAHLYIDDVGVYRVEDAPPIPQDQVIVPPVIPDVMGHPTRTGLKTSDHVRVEAIDGIWYLVTPEGKAYFDRGINHCSYPNGWWNNLNPDRGQNIRRLFPQESAWQDYALQSVKDWGFTSLGAWSYEGIAPKARQNDIQVWSSLAVDWVGNPRFTLKNQQGGLIPIGGTTRMADPFNPQWREAVTRHIEQRLTSSKNNVMGYFTENENSLGVVPLYGYAWTPSARKAMSEWLTKRYNGDIAQLNIGWKDKNGKAGSYASFDDAVQNPPSFNNTDAQSDNRFTSDMEDFEDFIVETYVDFIIGAVRKINPNALLTSPRLPGSNFVDYKPLRHFKKFDIVAVNCYGSAYYSRKQMDQLKAIHDLTGRPILITEWCAPDDSGITDPEKSAQERALRYQTMMRQISALPFVVGMHWQMWFAATKSDGGKMGLVDDNEKPLPFISRIADIHRAFDQTQP